MSATDHDNSRGDGIGSYLRTVRETQDKSLDEAARVTRIGKNYLMAIEAEAYDKFPSAAYLKGFLRIYAKFLGLSGDDLVARYEQSNATSPAKTAEPPVGIGFQRASAAKEGTRRWLVPVVLLLLITIAVLITGKRDERPEQSSSAVRTSQPAAGSPPTQLNTSSATLRGPGLPPRTEGVTNEASTAPAEPPGKGIILKLKVNQDSSLDMTIDDTIAQPYELKAGDLIEWKAEKSFTMDISNAGGIEAEFNGKQLAPLGEPGKAAHVVLKKQGL